MSAKLKFWRHLLTLVTTYLFLLVRGISTTLVIDDSTRLFRVQCKTGRVKNGVLIFSAYSQSGNGSVKMNYRGLADLFAVLNPEDDKVYLVPVDEVGVTDVSLRLAPTLNHQTQKVRWAEPYLLKL